MTDEQLKAAVGRNISTFRKARHMSVADFGDLMGTETGIVWKRQTVSAAENGNRAFTITDLAAIARVLGVGMGDLVGDEWRRDVKAFDGEAAVKAIVRAELAATISELSRLAAAI